MYAVADGCISMSSRKHGSSTKLGPQLRRLCVLSISPPPFPSLHTRTDSDKMEALLGRIARLGAGVAGAAFVGNNFLFNGAFSPQTQHAHECCRVGPRNSTSRTEQKQQTVEGGYRAVVFDRFKGVLDKPLQEGTSVVIPVLQVRTIASMHTHTRPSHQHHPSNNQRRRTSSTCGASRA